MAIQTQRLCIRPIGMDDLDEYAENFASQRVLVKLGFQSCGVWNAYYDQATALFRRSAREARDG